MYLFMALIRSTSRSLIWILIWYGFTWSKKNACSRHCSKQTADCWCCLLCSEEVSAKTTACWTLPEEIRLRRPQPPMSPSHMSPRQHMNVAMNFVYLINFHRKLSWHTLCWKYSLLSSTGWYKVKIFVCKVRLAWPLCWHCWHHYRGNTKVEM